MARGIFPGIQQVPPILARATALAQLGRWEEAERALQEAFAIPHRLSLGEALTDAAQVHLWYGDPSRADALLDEFEREHLPSVNYRLYSRNRVWSALFARDEAAITSSVDVLAQAPQGLVETAELFSSELTLARVALRHDALTVESVSLLHEIAADQEAPLERELARLMSALSKGPVEVSRALETGRHTTAVTILADDIALGIADLSEEALRAIETHARQRPWRWRPMFRRLVTPEFVGCLRAAGLLSLIGTREDVRLLRGLARSGRRYPRVGDMSRRLAQDVASTLEIHDLGRTELVIGDRRVAGEEEIRRKVLAMLLYLVTQPQLSATRDQVLDAPLA